MQSKNRQQEARNRRLTEERISAAAVEKITYHSISQLSNLVEVYKGSISTVYRAKCVASGSRVVVKMYHKGKMTPKQLHKLQREIDIQTLVRDCPYVCQLLAHFEDDEKKYLVLEDCAGGDLFKRMLKQGGNLTEARVCTDVIVPLLRVLESLDTLNILHRDIKPENIFLSSDDRIRLGDFGLAIDTTKEIPFCRSGMAICSYLCLPAVSRLMIQLLFRHARLYGTRGIDQSLHPVGGARSHHGTVVDTQHCSVHIKG